MMCARLLRPEQRGARHGRILRWSESSFERAAKLRGDPALGARRSSAMMFCCSTVRLNIYLYVIIPEGLFPQQDTGACSAASRPTRASRSRRCEKLASFMTIISADPAVDNVVGFTGGNSATGSIFVRSSRWPSAKCPPTQVIARLRQSFKEPAPTSSCKARRTSASAAAAKRQYQYALQGDDLGRAARMETEDQRGAGQAARAGRRQQRPAGERTPDRAGDRPRLGCALGVSRNNRFHAQRPLRSASGFHDLQSSLNQYHVVMEAAPEYWQARARTGMHYRCLIRLLCELNCRCTSVC